MPDTFTFELKTNEKIKKFQEELNTWKKMLHSRMENNILMKNMLSNILMNNYGQNYLAEMEEFQNNFIREDEITDILRNDVNKFDNLSYGQLFKDEEMRESCEKRMKKLRNFIRQSENNFCSLFASFEDFVYTIAR